MPSDPADAAHTTDSANPARGAHPADAAYASYTAHSAMPRGKQCRVNTLKRTAVASPWRWPVNARRSARAVHLPRPSTTYNNLVSTTFIFSGI